jgi:DNA polymerase elongation subunit (family B)
MSELVENIDNLTKQELEEKIKEYQNLADRYFNYEQSIKRILNSIYGAFGNEHFYFFNLDIAESITLQGQDAILYTEKMLNTYFNKFWHKDKELHDKLGITVSGEVFKPVVIYIDTDSCYVSFQEAIEKSTWDKGEKEFILALYEHRLKDYINKVMQKYAEAHGTQNFLNFELESVARNAIWLAKKKYIQNIRWTDPDIHFDDLTKVKTKGFDNIQSSTPLFARKKLTDALKIIFAEDNLQMSKMVKFLTEAKKEFKLAPIEDICYNVRMNNYEKYIVDDQKTFEIAFKCPTTCRSAGFHNYLLNNSKFRDRYQVISNGEKIKLYQTTDKMSNVFAFIAGSYPYEFAPPIDYEAQFEKCMIEPLNRVFTAIGMQTLNRNLIYANSLF